jgi:hypothetical protein
VRKSCLPVLFTVGLHEVAVRLQANATDDSSRSENASVHTAQSQRETTYSNSRTARCPEEMEPNIFRQDDDGCSSEGMEPIREASW